MKRLGLSKASWGMPITGAVIRAVTRTMAWTGLCALSVSGASAQASEFFNPLFAYTHLLPSPLTLPAGRLMLGTQAAYGVFNSLEVGTNLWRDIYQVYNGYAKVNLVDYPGAAFSVSLGYENYNLRDIDSANPDMRVSTWLPGATLGMEIVEDFAYFVGGNLNITKTAITTDGIETSGYVHGAQIENDIAWAYNPRKNGIGNVLAAGVTYDITYKIAGFGVSHYWRGFRLGIHYYPNADRNRVQPILAGGAVVDF